MKKEKDKSHKVRNKKERKKEEEEDENKKKESKNCGVQKSQPLYAC